MFIMRKHRGKKEQPTNPQGSQISGIVPEIAGILRYFQGFCLN